MLKLILGLGFLITAESFATNSNNEEFPEFSKIAGTTGDVDDALSKAYIDFNKLRSCIDPQSARQVHAAKTICANRCEEAIARGSLREHAFWHNAELTFVYSPPVKTKKVQKKKARNLRELAIMNSSKTKSKKENAVKLNEIEMNNSQSKGVSKPE